MLLLVQAMCTKCASHVDIVQTMWWCHESWSVCQVLWYYPRQHQITNLDMGCPFDSLDQSPEERKKRKKKIKIWEVVIFILTKFYKWNISIGFPFCNDVFKNFLHLLLHLRQWHDCTKNWLVIMKIMLKMIKISLREIIFLIGLIEKY